MRKSGRTTREEVEHFRSGLIRMPYERPIYERTFISEPVNRESCHTKCAHHNQILIQIKSIFRRVIVFFDVIVSQVEFQYEL